MTLKIIKCVTDKEIAEANLVRNSVFVDEQGIEQKIQEEGDEKCDHSVAYLDDKPVGAGRISNPEKKTAKIERMAVIKKARGQGIGRKILEVMLEFIATKDIVEVTLDAQHPTKGFYEKFGFKQVGEIFKEVGILHVKMKKLM